MTQNANLQKIRQNLEEDLERLLLNTNDSQVKQGNGTESNLDRGDLAQDYVARERRLALQDVEESQVAQIKEALKRIENGTYGICADCGDTIPPERLEIIPYATLCVNCQQSETKFKGVK